VGNKVVPNLHRSDRHRPRKRGNAHGNDRFALAAAPKKIRIMTSNRNVSRPATEFALSENQAYKVTQKAGTTVKLKVVHR
jgi:hypothetical protein